MGSTKYVIIIIIYNSSSEVPQDEKGIYCCHTFHGFPCRIITYTMRLHRSKYLPKNKTPALGEALFQCICIFLVDTTTSFHQRKINNYFVVPRPDDIWICLNLTLLFPFLLHHKTEQHSGENESTRVHACAHTHTHTETQTPAVTARGVKQVSRLM